MADQKADTGDSLLHTPLHARHVEAGARVVPFAGYAMPVQYPTGILAEHLWTRSHAGLFDVSHMGQASLAGPDHETTARALETLVPAAIVELAPGQQRYTQLLTDEGGILDDLMVTRPADPALDGTLFLVVNAGTKEGDYAHRPRAARPTVPPRSAPRATASPPGHCKGARRRGGDKRMRAAPEARGSAFIAHRPESRWSTAGTCARLGVSGYIRRGRLGRILGGRPTRRPRSGSALWRRRAGEAARAGGANSLRPQDRACEPLRARQSNHDSNHGGRSPGSIR